MSNEKMQLKLTISEPDKDSQIQEKINKILEIGRKEISGKINKETTYLLAASFVILKGKAKCYYINEIAGKQSIEIKYQGLGLKVNYRINEQKFDAKIEKIEVYGKTYKDKTVIPLIWMAEEGTDYLNISGTLSFVDSEKYAKISIISVILNAIINVFRKSLLFSFNKF